MSFEQFLELFRLTFPEFSDVSDNILEIYYNQVLAIFGCCDNAMIWLAAHLFAVDKESNISVAGDGTTVGGLDSGQGEHQQEKVGEVLVVMKTMADEGKDVYFTSTHYGTRFLTFRNACPSRAMSFRVSNGY